ncbi:hypothetical protein ACL02S_01650 [Nocardia sp. 004]|uniref:hypothetical protein n=1 Tax=Nocardia sp. 004 TaxID=3385978 RepID=UPI0039A0303C
METGELVQLLEQRTRLIRSIRSAIPELAHATLILQSDGSYLDLWRWESAEAMTGSKSFPPITATATPTTHHTVVDGQVLDER